MVWRVFNSIQHSSRYDEEAHTFAQVRVLPRFAWCSKGQRLSPSVLMEKTLRIESKLNRVLTKVEKFVVHSSRGGDLLE